MTPPDNSDSRLRWRWDRFWTGVRHPYLAQVLSVYHEEWERRYGGRWILAE